MLAPPSCPARPVSSVCSRLSTVQGPAMKPKWSPPIRRPRTWIVVGSGDVSRDTHLYGRWTGRTCWTPAKPSRARLASSSRSPIAPITVDSLPGATRPRAPIRSRRVRTSSTWSGAARRLITTSSCSSAESSAVSTASSFGMPSTGPDIGCLPSWPAVGGRVASPVPAKLAAEHRSDFLVRADDRAIAAAHRLDSADRAGEENPVGVAEALKRDGLLAHRDVELGGEEQDAAARDSGQDAPVGGRGHQRPVTDDEQVAAAGFEDRAVAIDEQRQPRREGGIRAREQPTGGPFVRADPTGHHMRGELHALIPARHDQGRLDGRDDDVVGEPAVAVRGDGQAQAGQPRATRAVEHERW